MPTPLAICIEDLTPDAHPRFLRCVAVVGRKPGLRVRNDASVVWQSDEDVACELWVSADDRMILYRAEGSGPVMVERSGRTLEAPAGKPVVLLDQDAFTVAGRRLRLHIHGTTQYVSAPSPLPPQKTSQAARVAAAVVLGAAVVGCDKPVEVREVPPAVPVQTTGAPPTATPPASSSSPAPSATPPASTAEPVPTKSAPPATAKPVKVPPPIEVREAPPDMPDPSEM